MLGNFTNNWWWLFKFNRVLNDVEVPLSGMLKERWWDKDHPQFYTQKTQTHQSRVHPRLSWTYRNRIKDHSWLRKTPQRCYGHPQHLSLILPQVSPWQVQQVRFPLTQIFKEKAQMRQHYLQWPLQRIGGEDCWEKLSYRSYQHSSISLFYH
jgi:hypothetical protein